MERYNRHHILPEVGIEGQKKLSQASVLIVGIGGLGSPVAMYLTAAGVGRIGIMDDDLVSLTNLQRQILYNEEQIGERKSQMAKARLEAINSLCKIEEYPFALTADNAQEIISKYDIVVDGSDNYQTRYIIDETTFRMQKPYVYGSIAQFHGQVSVFNTMGAGRYSDLFASQGTTRGDDPPLGVVGSVPGVIGSIEATEVIKLITGAGTPLINTLLVVNLLTMEFKKLAIG